MVLKVKHVVVVVRKNTVYNERVSGWTSGRSLPIKKFVDYPRGSYRDIIVYLISQRSLFFQEGRCYVLHDMLK